MTYEKRFRRAGLVSPCRGSRPPTTPAPLSAARDRHRGYIRRNWFHRELGKMAWDHRGMGSGRDGLVAAVGDVFARYEEPLLFESAKLSSLLFESTKLSSRRHK